MFRKQQRHLKAPAHSAFDSKLFLVNVASKLCCKFTVSDIFCVVLQEGINNLFHGYLCQNEEASKKRCENILSSLSGTMTEKLKKGSYAIPGGYALFSQDLEDIVKKYKIQANKGVKVIINV